jgi:3',5'-nucleoside bisphosphate phosphatase
MAFANRVETVRESRMNLDWLDPHSINADLHCHSVASDGTLTPEQLVLRAKEQGVEIWSLTDHDELSGLEAAREAACDLGVNFVPGVEISVTWAGDTIHVVGLNVNYREGALVDNLRNMRKVRVSRAQLIGRDLERHGIKEAYEGALQYVRNPLLISRTHFARHLVSTGVCQDMREVFTRFLTPGKPGYIVTDWASLQEAVSWIHQSGGYAVLAHPGRYRLSEIQMDALLTQFFELGGQAIEVVTASHTVDQYREYARKAMLKGLKASRGSDFHCPDESRVNLGELPPLPDGCVPIWDNWANLRF